MSDDSKRTEAPLAPNFLDTPTLNKCPNKELEVTIINDAENTIYKLNLQTHGITTELEAIKIFVKEQFYLILSILSLTETDNRSERQRNKEWIGLPQQQNNLVEENKSKTTIIQMLTENQNN